MAVEVKHREDDGRFVVELNGGEDAYLSYHARDDGTLEYESTYVPESHRGEGIAEELVVEALNYARDRGSEVVPTCPYVRHVMQERRPEYRDLMADDGAEDR